MIRATLLTVMASLSWGLGSCAVWSQDVKEAEGPPVYLTGVVQMNFLTAQHEDSTFFLRRGRIIANFKQDYVFGRLQLQLAPRGVSIYDGFVQLTEPWTGEKMVSVLVGQKNVPFGYDTPTPPFDYLITRTAVAKHAFPGNRDLGVLGHFEWNLVRVDLGVVNGQGIEAAYADDDPTTMKNVVARAGVEVDWMWAEISGYRGNAKYPDPADPTLDITGDRHRLGADFGLRAELIPGLGRSIVIFELVQGRNFETDFRGGYVMAAQELMYGFTALVRYSIFDPDSSIDSDSTKTLDAGVNYRLDDHIQFRVQATFPGEEGASVENDSFLAEIMLRF